MSDSYVLTEAAEADVRALIRDTRAQWCLAQTRIWWLRLNAVLRALAAGDGPFKEMSALYPQLWMPPYLQSSRIFGHEKSPPLQAGFFSIRRGVRHYRSSAADLIPDLSSLDIKVNFPQCKRNRLEDV